MQRVFVTKLETISLSMCRRKSRLETWNRWLCKLVGLRWAVELEKNASSWLLLAIDSLRNRDWFVLCYFLLSIKKEKIDKIVKEVPRIVALESTKIL